MKTSNGLYPLRFRPILKRLIWGGRRLESVLGIALPPGDDYAESWEIADHRDDVSRVAEGPLKGKSLRELIATDAAGILGNSRNEQPQFPLLVKFLDAHDVLSVQVHPNDELGALLANDRGKTEAWYILHAEPGSLIYAGLRAGVTRDEFRRAIESKAVEPLLHRFEARPGQCVFIPAGTVHAIGAGVVLAEIQQMSDATFRIDDWGRVGADGKPRTLHVEEALESIDFAAGPVEPIDAAELRTARSPLVHCPYFDLDLVRAEEAVSVGSAGGFTILIGVEGAATIRGDFGESVLQRGETLLLPAGVGACMLVPDGRASLLSCTAP